MRSATVLPISTTELLDEAERGLQMIAMVREEYLTGQQRPEIVQRSGHRIEIRWRLAVAQVLRLKRQLAVERHALAMRPDDARLSRILRGIDCGLGAIGVEDRVVARVQSWS